MRKVFGILILAAFIWGCAKDDDGNVIQKQSNCLILSAPATNAKISPFYPDFAWQGCKTGNYRFTLSKKSDFSVAEFDTLLASNNFKYDKKIMEQATTFFWRIIQDSDTTISQFETQKYAETFKGTYLVNVNKRYEQFSGPILYDTTYSSSLEVLSLPDGSVKITESASNNTNTVYYLSSVNTDKNRLTLHGTWGGGYTQLYYFPKDKLVGVYFRGSGRGIWWAWHIGYKIN